LHHAPIDPVAGLPCPCRRLRLRQQRPVVHAAGLARGSQASAKTGTDVSAGARKHGVPAGQFQQRCHQAAQRKLTRQHVMALRFSKMHGSGNDFAVIDSRHGALNLGPATIRAMADRHTGIGFDQLLSVEPARDGASAFYYGIWNADGSPSGQCGNGVRCVAAWLHRAGELVLDETVQIESPSGPVAVRMVDAYRVTVDMGEPIFDPARIPFDAPHAADRYLLEVDGQPLEIGATSMGNPHAVIAVDDLSAPALAQLGPALTGHARFREGANAGFVQKLTSSHVRLRVHERGSGWTLACGTGACAAMAILRQRGEVDAHVQVDLPGGSLQIDWRGPGERLCMTGPARFVFEGEWLEPHVDD
jgi:diaminopimelate epimerase